MVDNIDDTEEFSLADLADLDVSDIEEIRFEQLPAGTYEFEVKDADLKDGEIGGGERQGEKRGEVIFELKVLECRAITESNAPDKESLIGKTHTEKFFVNAGDSTEDQMKAIGRIRAFVSDMGLDSKGKFGDIVRNTKGHIFRTRIIKQVNKQDKSISYARVKFDPPKK